MKLAFIYQNNLACVFLSLISGSIGILSFSPFDFWPASIFSISLLNLLILKKNIKQSFIISFAWGLGFFGIGINWVYISIAMFGDMIWIINIFIVILLISYLSLYPGIFGSALSYFTPNTNTWRLIFFAPALWQFIEFLRSFILTGFPWLQFGYTQINGPLKSLAPIFGVEMITFFLFNISGLFLLSIIRRNIFVLIYTIILLFAQPLLGYIKWIKPVKNNKIQVTLVQGNIQQSTKWESNYLEEIKKIYLTLSKPYIGKSALIIWPESAIPSAEINNQYWLQNINRILKNSNTNLITGIIDLRKINKNYKLFNSIIVLGNDLHYRYNTKNRYDKYHLVPFGEYVPLEKILKHISPFFNLPIPGFNRGDYKQKQLIVGNTHISAAICYEIILGTQIRDNFKSNSEYLLAVSNDAWFGKTIGPWQHLQMARMRSLELGRPLLYATNNGITAIVQTDGSIKNILPQFKASVLTTEVTTSKGVTPYVFWGNIPMWITVFLFALIGFIFNRR
ncbi:Apolipoprotein N-acyltransferase [Candidatus Providencia siddallii]|uniref:Apolipoprotein N-acyltransferase n=1 Tax=Candidatus Providencia siddallii TaxID=1715285 RepID=A0A0M6W9J0_9GAMM|nr:Apolipoprotein N-acyltransferase [Candidatus Providencia siddallii]